MLAKLIYFRKFFTFKDLTSNNRWTHPNNLFAFGVKLFLHVLPFLSLKRLVVWGTLQFLGGGQILDPNLLNFWTKISLTIKRCRNNFQTFALIWLGFLGVRFEVVVGERRLPHLKLVRIMLETSNSAHKYTLMQIQKIYLLVPRV